MKKKRLLSCILAAGMCLASLGMPMIAKADGQKVVTLGADLSQDQKIAVLKYFGIYGQPIQTLIITNQDERDHLGHYVPLEQIGTRTFSCALVCPTNSGGIQVKTANLSWVTSNMIATTLSTAGVVNCDVLAAAPFEVSGTGALTGVIMAYESASGVALDPVKKELATQEMITTTQIANTVGQNQATNIVNEIKIHVIENAVVEPEEVEEIVEEVIEEVEYVNPEVTLTDEDRALLTGLMTQIAEQEYDYEEVRDTLQRVEENVSGMEETLDGLREHYENYENITVEPEYDEEMEYVEEPETLAEDSILMNTDDSALGENVHIEATAPEAVVETEYIPETPVDDGGFDITTSDSYIDDSTGEDIWVEVPEVPVDQGGEVLDGTGMDDGVVMVNPEEESFWDEFFGGDPAVEPEVPADQNEEIWIPEEEAVLDGSGMDDGVVIPEEVVPEEVPVEIPVLELTGADYVPDSGDGSVEAAGLSQVRFVYGNGNLVPVSGVLTVYDSSNSVYATVDLTNKDQVRALPLSEEGKAYYGWGEGTQFVVNLGTNLLPYESYTVVMDAMFAQTADPSVLEGVPTAAANLNWTIDTDGVGAYLKMNRVADIYAGAAISGDIIMDEAAYANISSYDADKLAFDMVDFGLDTTTSFTMNCLASGSASFMIDYYDAEWNYLTSATVNVMIP